MPFPDMFPTLESPRLILRALTDDDAAALFAILSDPPTMRYWATPPWTSPAQGETMIARARDGFAAKDALRFAVVEKGGAALIGTCTLFGIDGPHRRAEVGYILRRDRWGKGLMREALGALLDYAFGPLELHRVEADADPRNVASVGLLERLGFSREGLLRERWRVNGEVSDSVFLGLLEPTWRRRALADPPAKWPDDWRAYHRHGLECLLASGRVTADLFTEPWDDEGAKLLHRITAKDKDQAWLPFVGSRMLAAVGVELLLQGLYARRGHALRGAPFGMLLAPSNLARLGDPKRYAPLRTALEWREDAAQTVLRWTIDARDDKYALGRAVHDLHDELLDGADDAHREAVARVLSATNPA